MKIHNFSIVVGGSSCNADCHWCISKMTPSDLVDCRDINWRNFKIACRIMEMGNNGLSTVMLTGKGEPMFYASDITLYLKALRKHSFPLVELQTNGTLIQSDIDELKLWYELGLTLVCISIAHYDINQNNALMRIPFKYSLWKVVDTLHEIGLSVRLNCTMMKSGIYSVGLADRLIDACWEYKVEQLTFREITAPHISELADNRLAKKVYDYVQQEKPNGAIDALALYLEGNGATRLLELPHRAIVYDYKGQNVCLANCITSTVNPEDVRQLIFFPDGRIAYDWKYRAARLL